MNELHKMLVNSPQKEEEEEKAWNKWIYALENHNGALIALRESAQSVDAAFEEYINVRGN